MARALHNHRWTIDTQSLRHRRWRLTRLSSSCRGSPWESGFGDTDGFFRDWPDRFRTHQHGFVLQESGLWDYVYEVCGIAGELINRIFLGLYLTTKSTR